MEATPRPSINIMTALLLLSLHGFIGPAAMAEQPSISADQASLLALKQHITDDPEDLLSTNWTETTSVCNWVGITCGTTHTSRVTRLNLACMGLSGTLPPQLGNLSFLAYFNITNNTFHGSLPVELSHLRRLQYFSVRGNFFEGEIPPWLASLPRLKYLFLNANGFSGTIPESICNVSTLQTLDLSENQLAGTILPLIFNIPLLKVIDLSNNQLSGAMPSSVFSESPLLDIDHSSNSLSGVLPQNICGNLPNLQGLFLSFNQFSGGIPSSLSECRQLQVLALSVNNFSGTIPRELGNLTLLNGLYLGVNNLIEYGSGGVVSTRGDVYSYGILLMETFTGKGPTDEMFSGEESLKRWVKNSLPDAVGDVLDAKLLSREELTAAKLECVSTILELAAHCCTELPGERKGMNDVLAKLEKIRTVLGQM
ncbi:LRR receptor-like serine/threonine-protein kinase FLS2 isoform X4 [Rhodamnia argentea]|uniref:LRR receptor-like serine/threonine-protein kinase FLS2 isoform X4 n=1 Tax=Rhodamnia argentea TaxID=178133 RepID=A0ABM3H558_9MYRT|nr:LRR receptor-like serine/threonine-protein kinase FLS2 isoform X4 [Rhodamnia argentea]